MDYIDLNGKLVQQTTSQDKLLDDLYRHMLGRLLLKPLVTPAVSRLVGPLLSSPFSTRLIPHFIESNNIDMSAYEKRKYRSFNDFFTRRIQEGKRPIPDEEEVLVSPCDCKATVYKIQEDSIFSVKNTEYTLRSLLKSVKLARRFQGGYCYILRLTVDDYHRYVYAASGTQSKNYHIDGTFHTVNPVANDYLPIYKENTREYTVIHTPDYGSIVQMEVGALLVGRIKNHKESCPVTRGEEKGYFEYGGSTIIILTEKDTYVPRQDLMQNTRRGYETKLLQGHVLGYAPIED